MTIATDIQTLAPGSVVDLFEIDLTSLGGEKLYFHPGRNGLISNVVWNGITYNAFPIQAEGFEATGNGRMPRPTVRVANVTGLISSVLRDFDDLIGCKVTRRRTLARYLDAVNFRRDNLLLWSEDLTKSVYSAGNMGKTSAGQTSITVNSDPQIGQRVLGLGSIKNRTFSFGVEMSGIGASIGKSIRIYLYSDTVNEVKTAMVGPLTATQAPFKLTGTFTTSTDTAIYVRLDPEGSPGWVAGESLNISKWQANEGSTLNPYQMTTGTWNPSADPTQEFPPEVWFIDRKSTETKMMVEFELAASWDVQGVLLPRRQAIANTCAWRYRGADCGYAGGAVADGSDNATGDINLDQCGKRLSSCKLRFGAYAVLPFGAFPAVGLIR